MTAKKNADKGKENMPESQKEHDPELPASQGELTDKQRTAVEQSWSPPHDPNAALMEHEVEEEAEKAR